MSGDIKIVLVAAIGENNVIGRDGQLPWRLPSDLKRYERFLAHLTHHGLYGLLFLLPLSGWMMSSAKNYPVSWFGLAKLPNLVPPNETLFDVLKETHEVLATALMAVAALHVLAALQHQFIRRDDILRRMLPFTAPGTKHGAAKLALATVVAIGVSWLAFRTLQPGAVATVAPPAAADLAAPPGTAASAANSPSASTWRVDVAASALGFGFMQAGAATDGRFGHFTAGIDFTATPAPAGRFDVSIDIASVDTQDKDRNEQLKNADLFDVDVHAIPAHKDEPAHLHYDLRFLFIADVHVDDERAFSVNADESHDCRWFPLTELANDTSLGPETHRMIELSLQRSTATGHS